MRNLTRSIGSGVLRVTIAIGLLGLGSCARIGPKTIPRDSFDYGAAISNSSKEQLLTNVVRMRYVDAPVFVDVSSVINQYSLEGEVSLGAGWQSGITGGDTALIGGSGRWADRPTITYTPVSGRQFAISLLTPIQPEAIFALVQAGWPAELILQLTVREMNGIENAVAGPSSRRPRSEEFLELIQIWNRLRKARAVGLRREGQGETAKILVYRTTHEMSPDVQRDLDRLATILDLDPEAEEYKLFYGLVPEGRQSIAVLTMSMLELINEMAWRIDVPFEHVEEGRTGSTFEQQGSTPLIRVQYAAEKPENAYAAVENRGHWFYIDDRDVASKRTFAILQILLSLTESGDAARGPVVTIGS